MSPLASGMTVLDQSGVGTPDAAWGLQAPPAPPWRRYVGTVKPVVDRFVGVVLLVLLAPLLLAVALAVRLSLGSGVLFVQERIGRRGRTFNLYKFRTMTHCRRSADRPFDGVDRRAVHKHRDDPRLTPTGRLLRRLSLDEVPQLVNVVKGEMSLVGPRPELPEIVARYEPWQHRRHDVKPGITGLWQVTARHRPMHEATDVDLDYLHRVSPWTDAKILLKTASAVLRRDGW